MSSHEDFAEKVAKDVTITGLRGVAEQVDYVRFALDDLATCLDEVGLIHTSEAIRGLGERMLAGIEVKIEEELECRAPTGSHLNSQDLFESIAEAGYKS